MPTRRIRKTGPAVYSVLEAPYESAMLVLLNHFIGRDAGHSAINFLDIATSRDGFHISGLPAFDSTDYIPLVGPEPMWINATRAVSALLSALVDSAHSLHCRCL